MSTALTLAICQGGECTHSFLLTMQLQVLKMNTTGQFDQQHPDVPFICSGTSAYGTQNIATSPLLQDWLQGGRNVPDI